MCLPALLIILIKYITVSITKSKLLGELLSIVQIILELALHIELKVPVTLNDIKRNYLQHLFSFKIHFLEATHNSCLHKEDKTKQAHQCRNKNTVDLVLLLIQIFMKCFEEIVFQ